MTDPRQAMREVQRTPDVRILNMSRWPLLHKLPHAEAGDSVSPSPRHAGGRDRGDGTATDD
jgi:hypothetical protein